MTETVSARVLIEAQVGILPGTPEPELTRQWAISSEEWYDQANNEDRLTLLQHRVQVANDYALALMPQRINWSQVTVIYL